MRTAPAQSWSLSTKALITVLVIVGGLLSGYGVLSIKQNQAERRHNLVERAELLARIQANALAVPIWDYDEQQINAALLALAKDPDFVTARVLDPSGAVAWLYAVRPSTPDDLRIAQAILHPTGDGEERLGTLEVAVSTARLDAAQRRSARLYGGVLGILIIGILTAIYVTFRRISEPLDHMAAVMGDLGQGVHDVAVPALDRQDEVGNIARAIEMFRRNAIEVQHLHKLRDRAAEEERLRIRAAVESSSDAILITDQDSRAIYVNGAFKRLFGYDANDLARRNLLRVFGTQRDAARAVATVRRQGSWSGELDLRAKGRDRPIPIDLRTNVILSEGDETVGYVVRSADVTERRAAEAEIRHMAHHDALTGLPNRTFFNEHLAQVLARAKQHDRGVSLLLLDLDRFKIVNDTLGHPVGDALLKEVAARLKGCVRGADVVARLGGDEFAVIVQADSAVDVATRVLECLGQPYRLERHEIHSGTSIGIARYPDDGQHAEQLVSNADMALYKAKQAGRGAFCFFEQQMGAQMRTRRSLEQDLRRAIEREELELHYQPQVDISTGEWLAAEALMRWRHPSQGPIPPTTFIPIAEEAGLILALGEWAMHVACRQARAWQDLDYDLRIAVNLSAAQFHHDIVGMTQHALLATSLAPRRLEVEITEGMLLSDTRATRKALTSLRGLGVSVALDDFGTGYSSLSYLRQLPIDKLKLDRSFVGELETSAQARAVVDSIVDLGHALDMTITVEGVETAKQHAELQDLGCDLAQGYLFAKPMPAAVFERSLIDRRPLAGSPATDIISLFNTHERVVCS